MQSPLAPLIHLELRAFVTAAGNRRALPTTCHVGHPAGQQTRFPHGVVDDPSLRADLVERAVDGLLVIDDACAWVTRGGALDLTDADAAWHTAARTAFGRHGLPLPAFLVLNRTGWVDLVSGEQRQWHRVRNRSPSPG
ncbi:MAG: hypothetical protein JWR90_2858 [Marmoricola sp.]|jgi:hypothetical protein|nr:hypothetical protein [Marmoricola sp.]